MPRFGNLPGRQAAFDTFDNREIKQILSDEHWYGDGQPRWKKALTYATAQHWWKKGKNRLGANMSSHLIHDGGVAKSTIENCLPNARCCSNGCYLCTRAFQKWLVSAAIKLYRQPNSGYEDRTINYVFPEGQVKKGHLHEARFDQFMDKFIKAIESTGSVPFGIFAFDISWNDDTAKFQRGVCKKPPKEYWQIHIFGYVRTNDYEAVKRTLLALSPENVKISKPVLSSIVKKTPAKAFSYVFKPTAFKRKVRWVKGAKRRYWGLSKGKALSTAAHVEYLQAAHMLGISRRIGLLNLHPVFKKSKPGSPKTIALRLIKPRKTTM